MASYRDFDMLNQAISGLGDSFERRRQQNVINQREAERIALEKEMRDIQQQREDRMEKEGNRRFGMKEERMDRMEADAKARADREERRLDLANQPHVQADVFDPVNGTSMSFTGTADQINAMQSEYAKKNPGKQLQVSNKKAFAAQFNVGGAQFSFQDPDAANRFAADMKEKHGIDVYKAGGPTVSVTPGGQELVTDGKGRVIKGAPAPDPGHTTTTIKTEPPPAWAPPGTKPTQTTNTTTRVPNITPKAVRQAQGGYKIGTRYKGGLTYLGGDPNDQNSWEQSD